MLKGEKVGLSAIEEADLKILLDWRNKPEYRQYFREYRELNMSQQKEWFFSKAIKDDSTLMFGITELETNELIGVCGLCYINWVNGNADLSLYDTGLAEESCKILFKYAFGELRLNRIWTEIYTIDKKKITLYKKLGMNIDGTLRESYFYNGKFIDSYIFSILKKEFSL